MWSDVTEVLGKRLYDGKCTICGCPLNIGKFHEDYPDEWKFCCHCLAWANAIIKDKNSAWVIEALKVSPTVKKIYERITLVG